MKMRAGCPLSLKRRGFALLRWDEGFDEVVHFRFVGVELADELELVACAVEVVVGVFGGEVLVA
jgi:hypothetical protein